MKIGIVTYVSLHSNFTNYGTVLQAWSLYTTIKKVQKEYIPILVDYCSNSMIDKNPLNPMDNMWDKDPKTRTMCEELLPEIRENYCKIEEFYRTEISLTKKTYYDYNFSEILNEDIGHFVCGSDSIWDIDEFGMDRVFWADHEIMRHNTISYAASFQDCFEKIDKDSVLNLLKNFAAVSTRDKYPKEYLEQTYKINVSRVLDPTLLLTAEDYKEIIDEKRIPKEKYLLFYSRRYDEKMEKTAYDIARSMNLKVVEISIRSSNKSRSIHRYDAGVEEFLGLVKNAEFVVTNSYHCICFSIIFKKEFVCYSREHCYNKIKELLELLGLPERMYIDESVDCIEKKIDYDTVNELLLREQEVSRDFLKCALDELS